MKAAKIIMSLLIASPLMLTACPGGDKNVSGRNGAGNESLPIPLPEGQQETPPKKPNAFFNGLKRSENLLYQNYYFSSSLNGTDLVYTDMDKIWKFGLTTFEVVAHEQGRTLRDVKLSYYDDIYAFARNIETLKLREAELKVHYSHLYDEYYRKTDTLGRLYIVQRARIYSNLLERREEHLYRVGIQETTRNGEVVVDHQQFSRNRRTTIVAAIKKAKTVCDNLTTMFNDVNFGAVLYGLNLRDCFSSPAVYVVSTLTNVDSMSKDEIKEAINNYSRNHSNETVTPNRPRVVDNAQPDLQPKTPRALRNIDTGVVDDDLSEFDDLDRAPRVFPNLAPETRAEEEEEDGPPTPPTSVRRRP